MDPNTLCLDPDPEICPNWDLVPSRLTWLHNQDWKTRFSRQFTGSLFFAKINTKKSDPKKVLQIFINFNNGRMLMILFVKESLLLESQAILSVGKNLKQ